MTWMMLSEIAKHCNGVLHGENVEITQVQRDSRQAQTGELFLALKGERFDAHDFVASVQGKASAALVERLLDVDIPQVVVDDVRLAMGRLGSACRQAFTKPVIALTGSNGKTTLKEMLTAILSQSGSTLATLGNLNNDLGVPLTLYRLRDEHDFAVVEMGANHFGEIDYLTHLVKPDVVILNNAGAAHLEGFGDIAGVAKAKGEIFSGLDDSGIGIINADDQYADYWRNENSDRQLLSFGLEKPADVKGEMIGQTILQIQYKNEQVNISLPLLGRHNALNALAAAAGAVALGIPVLQIKLGLESLQPVKGRLCPQYLESGALVIDDTYNANPTSVAAAINVLAQIEGERILILGDMGELGDEPEDKHKQLGVLAKHHHINEIYGLGAMTQHACVAFGQAEHGFLELDALLAALKQKNLNENTTILIKGSRSARMERVVDALHKGL